MIAFKDLPVVQQFQDKDKDKILSYIELVYSPESTLSQIDNLEARKAEAMKQTGLEDPTIPILKNDPVNILIHTYLGPYLNDDKYYNYMANKQLFWQMQELLMKPLEMEDTDEEVLLKRIKLKSELSEHTDKLLGRMQRQASELWGADAEKDMASDQNRKVVMMKSPEQRIRKTS